MVDERALAELLDAWVREQRSMMDVGGVESGVQLKEREGGSRRGTTECQWVVLVMRALDVGGR